MSTIISFRIEPSEVDQNQKFDMQTSVNKDCQVKYEIRGQTVKFTNGQNSITKSLIRGSNSFNESVHGEVGIVRIYAVADNEKYDEIYLH